MLLTDCPRTGPFIASSASLGTITVVHLPYDAENMFNLYFLRDVDLTAVSPWTLATALFTNLLLLFIALLFITVKRLYFHPLSKVPGPKIAAATGWYEFYYDCIVGGAYSRKLRGFHENYGKSIDPM